MLSRVGFLQVGEVEVLVSDDRVSGAVESCRSVVVQLEVSEPVVGQFVHQTVEEGRRSFGVDPELAALGEVVGLPDVVGVLALGDPDHPEELVDVVAGVSHDAAENDQNVVDVQVGHDLVGGRLVG